jgi:hypothetical protein
MSRDDALTVLTAAVADAAENCQDEQVIAAFVEVRDAS